MGNDYMIILAYVRKKVIKLLNLVYRKNIKIEQGENKCPVHVKFKPRGGTRLAASHGSLKHLIA
jgi:hypothetical protein